MGALWPCCTPTRCSSSRHPGLRPSVRDQHCRLGGLPSKHDSRPLSSVALSEKIYCGPADELTNTIRWPWLAAPANALATFSAGVPVSALRRHVAH